MAKSAGILTLLTLKVACDHLDIEQRYLELALAGAIEFYSILIFSRTMDGTKETPFLIPPINMLTLGIICRLQRD